MSSSKTTHFTSVVAKASEIFSHARFTGDCINDILIGIDSIGVGRRTKSLPV